MASAIHEGAEDGPSATRGALVLDMIQETLPGAEQPCGNDFATLDGAFEVAGPRRGVLAGSVPRVARPLALLGRSSFAEAIGRLVDGAD